MEKSTVINLVRDAVKATHDRMLEAARDTAAGVTDSENKAENKYDTRDGTGAQALWWRVSRPSARSWKVVDAPQRSPETV